MALEINVCAVKPLENVPQLRAGLIKTEPGFEKLFIAGLKVDAAEILKPTVLVKSSTMTSRFEGKQEFGSSFRKLIARGI